MTKDPNRNYLKAWREHRGMTQVQLAEAIGTTGAVISLLEAGERQLAPKWLHRLAPVLRTSVGHLLEVDPNELSDDIMEIWSEIPEERRPQAKAVLKTFGDSRNVVVMQTSANEKPPRNKTTRDKRT